MTEPTKPAEGKLSAIGYWQTYPTGLKPNRKWFTFADAYAAYCSQADAEKIACQEKALKIAVEATVVMREKIERLEAENKWLVSDNSQLQYTLERSEQAYRDQVGHTDLVRTVYQSRLEHSLDPIVRAKMLEPPPPIIIESKILLDRAEAAEARCKRLETKNTELLANLKRLTLARQGDVAEIKELREGLEANCGYQRITECAKAATVLEKKEKP